MASDLKSANNPKITALLTVVIFLCAGAQYSFAVIPAWEEALITGALSLGFSAFLVLLTNLTPHNLKHKLVFTRLSNEMPACRVDELCKKDIRVSFEDVCTRWPSVFEDSLCPSERNSRWYKEIYKPVLNEKSVTQAHRDFLLYRDVFSALFVMLVVAITWGVWGEIEFVGTINTAVYYILIGSSLLTLIAARNSGNRLVMNAVAAAL
ncbi:hypothetical protein [Pseudoalteromonas peptidolytica]|uniref:Uncharacterized protein n=1 Tax=Pseudoalteromonas peptidolytica F12-50-A1 TaxID=1315280 RepID=A0A8I0MS97_9GAMM|nr:hypothetical protein [Pseudoalteromonas peptidolytica]MBE0344855.1 hypothetical protein [Pseudoalteromonas peptidolytica F12-50-A1]NLR16761.1 hypothetical protein [Pseudoalteromonas peptidolytica]